MTSIFIKLLNLSISAGMLVLLVFAFRLFLKRYSRRAVCLLWIVVALRLIIPFSFESRFSIMPSGDFVSTVISDEESRNGTTTNTVKTSDNVGASDINKTDNNTLLAQTVSENETRNSNPDNSTMINMYPSENNSDMDTLIINGFFNTERFWKMLSVVWLFGVTAILLYIIIGYVRIRKLTSESVLYNELGIDNVFICNRIDTAFIFGIINPRIYLPERLDRTQSENIVAHELMHIKRRDYVWKLIGFILLMVYWFNPVMWLAYVLFCRDIEFACDEQVISKMNISQIKDYSDTLLLCSTDRSVSYGCPLAFGEVAVKDRIKAALSYKKPLLWVIIVAFVLVLGVCIFFFTKPSGEEGKDVDQVDNTESGSERLDIIRNKELVSEGYTDKTILNKLSFEYVSRDDNEVIGVLSSDPAQTMIKLEEFDGVSGENIDDSKTGNRNLTEKVISGGFKDLPFSNYSESYGTIEEAEYFTGYKGLKIPRLVTAEIATSELFKEYKPVSLFVGGHGIEKITGISIMVPWSYKGKNYGVNTWEFLYTEDMPVSERGFIEKEYRFPIYENKTTDEDFGIEKMVVNNREFILVYEGVSQKGNNIARSVFWQEGKVIHQIRVLYKKDDEKSRKNAEQVILDWMYSF
ncbi:MAG: hypothetical protein IK014_07505 [Lachnospiraceae bacterium]|nr:hypothetical protein [Lachnospiraceae bacterium]